LVLFRDTFLEDGEFNEAGRVVWNKSGVSDCIKQGFDGTACVVVIEKPTPAEDNADDNAARAMPFSLCRALQCLPYSRFGLGVRYPGNHRSRLSPDARGGFHESFVFEVIGVHSWGSKCCHVIAL
jgi:hypothetical protein